MTITYLLTKEAVADMTSRLYIKRSTNRTYIQAVRIIFPILALIIAGSVFSNIVKLGFADGVTTSMSLILIIVLIIGFVLVFPAIIRRIIYYNVLNDLKASWTENVQEITWELFDDHILTTGKNYESKLLYSGIKEIQEEDDFYYFRNYSASNIILPFTAFQSEVGRKEFIDQIQKNMYVAVR